MNDYVRRNLESGQRCRQWFIDFVTVIPGGSLFEAKTTAMTAKVDNVEDLVGQQEAAESEGFSATDVKGSERQDLIDALTPPRNAARAADADHPGTRDRYRFVQNMSHQDLLAAGRSFAEGGLVDDHLLQNYGAPTTWVPDVTAACDAFEATFGVQDSAKGASVAKNAEIAAELNDMNAFKSTITHLVKNYCADNPGALAAWHTAAHVEAPPKKKTPPTP